MGNRTITELISAEKIAIRVKELGAEITRKYAGQSVTLIGTLRGAVIFFADLSREIKLDAQFDFIKVSSYGEGSESCGEVRLDFPFEMDISGRHVILVEDIVDMGYTAKWLREYVQGFSPASVAICSLLDKPDRRKAQGVQIEYVGFTIPDEFVVGYGLDYAQCYRNLPYVAIVRE